jgi:hypothetical protein
MIPDAGADNDTAAYAMSSICFNCSISKDELIMHKKGGRIGSSL